MLHVWLTTLKIVTRVCPCLCPNSKQRAETVHACKDRFIHQTDLREKPLHAAAKMLKERPADVRHQVQASPSKRVSRTYLQNRQPHVLETP